MINNINLQRISRINDSSAQNTKQPQPQTLTDNQGEQVRLSEQGHLLQEMSNNPPPALAAEQIESLQSAINSGDYKIAYDKLADALLTFFDSE